MSSTTASTIMLLSSIISIISSGVMFLSKYLISFFVVLLPKFVEFCGNVGTLRTVKSFYRWVRFVRRYSHWSRDVKSVRDSGQKPGLDFSFFCGPKFTNFWIFRRHNSQFTNLFSVCLWRVSFLTHSRLHVFVNHPKIGSFDPTL